VVVAVVAVRVAQVVAAEDEAIFTGVLVAVTN
jgi:hypothetical protein